MPATLRAAESSLDALERLADAGLGAQELLEQAAERIERVIPNDGLFLTSTDPETTLSTGMGVVNELPHDQCQPTWDYEFLVPDVAKFADIARSGRFVADVHDATGGRPERSPRFRQFSAATGYRSELRVAFAVGGAAWGIGQINRTGAGRFGEDEKQWLRRAAPVVARGLRQALRHSTSPSSCDRGPGVLVLDADGTVLSSTRQAQAWMDALEPGLLAPHGMLPHHARGLALRARAAQEDGEPDVRLRLRTRCGVWLVMHAAPLAGTDQVALIVEPATGDDVSSMIVEACGLTARELDITRAIARGLSTPEIAARLFLSPHTVRDHVKAIFEKVGVSSRGELVHRIFHEHYSPPGHRSSWHTGLRG